MEKKINDDNPYSLLVANYVVKKWLNGEPSPSIELISDELNLSKYLVRKAINKMSDMGFEQYLTPFIPFVSQKLMEQIQRGNVTAMRLFFDMLQDNKNIDAISISNAPTQINLNFKSTKEIKEGKNDEGN